MYQNNLDNRIKILLNYFNNGKYVETISRSKQLLKKLPNFEAYLNNLIGLSYQKLNNLEIAKTFFLKVIKEYPGFLQAKLNYSIILKLENKIKDAQLILEKIIEENPNYVQAINNLANLKRENGDYESSAKLYNNALKINDQIPIIHYNLAVCYANLREKEKALIHAKVVIDLDPNFTRADKLISDLTDYKTDKTNHLNLMKQKLEAKILLNEQKIHLYFAIGKAYEDKKLYENAFDYYKLANESANIKFDFSEEENFFNHIKKIFEDIDFNIFEDQKFSSKQKKIIFICGMPRSGTTLLEQIISSHKNVSSLGETDYLLQITNKIFNIKFANIKNALSNDKDYLYNEYFNILVPKRDKLQIFTDKSLLNFKLIGLITLFFPNSKILVLKRNIEDNLLSIYKNYLPNQKLQWSFNEDDINKYFKLFNNYIKFWKKKFPNSFLEVKYEDLVNSNEQITRSIINYCDLEWDENCLEYYKNKSAIATASLNQANRPIYKTSINSFKNFSEYFKKKPRN